MSILKVLKLNIKIRNLIICFCSFDLSCGLLEKYNFNENVYIVLSCICSFEFRAPEVLDL